MALTFLSTQTTDTATAAQTWTGGVGAAQFWGDFDGATAILQMRITASADWQTVGDVTGDETFVFNFTTDVDFRVKLDGSGPNTSVSCIVG